MVIAYLDDFDKGDKLTFLYGSRREGSGAVAQNDTGLAVFIIRTDTDDNGVFVPVEGIVQRTADKQANKDQLGQVYTPVDADDKPVDSDKWDGLLRLKIDAAQDGQGTVDLDIVRTNAPAAKYDGAETETREVHAGDDKTYLLLTYTATQTIETGKLKFTVPSDWTPPQGTNPGEMGYTDIDSAGGIDSPEFDEVRSATVTIFSLDRGQTIEIHYGWYPESDEEGSGGAMAPTEAGPSTFVIEAQGSDDEDSGLDSC